MKKFNLIAIVSFTFWTLLSIGCGIGAFLTNYKVAWVLTGVGLAGLTTDIICYRILRKRLR